jgi:hypothetical protein
MVKKKLRANKMSICRNKRYCSNNPERCWMCERNEVNDVLEDCFERKPDKIVKMHFLAHGYNNGSKYACNYAVEPLEFKMTIDESKVTCKNCLKFIASHKPKEMEK